MANPLAVFMQHTISVEPYQGRGGTGASYGAAQAYTVFADDARRVVRDDTGAEVVSETTIYDIELDHETSYELNSRITLPSGRVAHILRVARNDAPGAPVPEHLEVALT